MFVGDGADAWAADGTVGGGDAARDGDGGDSGKVGGAVGAEEKGASRVIGFTDAEGFLANLGSGDGSGRNGEGVDTSVGHGQV